MPRFKKISESMKEDVEYNVKRLLEYCLENSDKIGVNQPDYAQAFGIFVGLEIAGYGSMRGAINIPAEHSNFRWWFKELLTQVLEEKRNSGK